MRCHGQTGESLGFVRQGAVSAPAAGRPGAVVGLLPEAGKRFRLAGGHGLVVLTEDLGAIDPLAERRPGLRPAPGIGGGGVQVGGDGQ